MKYAWIENGTVRDVCHGNPDELYHPDVAALYSAQVPDTAVHGDAWDGTTLTPYVPPAPEPVPPAPVVYPMMTPVQFYDALTPREETDILASTDPMVQTFARRLARALQTDTPVNPNSPTVQEGLAYLSEQKIIAAARIPQILAGVAQ